MRAPLWATGHVLLQLRACYTGGASSNRTAFPYFRGCGLVSGSPYSESLAALHSQSKHVPFRNSKLTYLLQDSLSGHSKTLMVVQVGSGALMPRTPLSRPVPRHRTPRASVYGIFVRVTSFVCSDLFV